MQCFYYIRSIIDTPYNLILTYIILRNYGLMVKGVKHHQTIVSWQIDGAMQFLLAN